MTMVGIGYRRPLASWIDYRPEEIECLEITAEHFYDGDLDRLRELRRDYPMFVHGLGLSLGTPGPLDEIEIEHFRQVVDAADPLWISEHVAFTRTAEVDLGHLNPIAPSCESLAILVDHARRLSDVCGKPLILENITSHLRLNGELSETEFLNRLTDQADCGILLDVTNLLINSHNYQFNAGQWLRELEPHRIVQLHVVGYSRENGRWEDRHCEPVQDDLLGLTEDVTRYAQPKAVILERDDARPPVAELATDLEKLKEIVRGD